MLLCSYVSILALVARRGRFSHKILARTAEATLTVGKEAETPIYCQESTLLFNQDHRYHHSRDDMGHFYLMISSSLLFILGLNASHSFVAVPNIDSFSARKSGLAVTSLRASISQGDTVTVIGGTGGGYDV